MKHTLFEGAVPLSSEAHRDLCISTGAGYQFAENETAVPLLVQEFAAAAGEFPIAFLERSGVISPIAITGLQEDENLFVGKDGSWDSDYVPAIFRQYPFVMIRLNGADKLALGIVGTHSAVNSTGEGRNLFEEDGSLSEFTKGVQTFVSKVARFNEQTRAFCEVLSKLDLFSPFRLSAKGGNGQQRNIGGLLTVNRQRLRELGAKELEELNSSDALELAYLQIHSLRNFRKLIKRIEGEVSVEGVEEAIDANKDEV